MTKSSSSSLETENNISEKFNGLVSSLQTLKQSISSVQQQIKMLDIPNHVKNGDYWMATKLTMHNIQYHYFLKYFDL